MLISLGRLRAASTAPQLGGRARNCLLEVRIQLDDVVFLDSWDPIHSPPSSIYVERDSYKVLLV